jgi:hypothetical protein
VVALAARRNPDVVPIAAGGQTAALAVLLFALVAVTGLLPFTPAIAALAFTAALVLHVPLAAAMSRR